MEKSGTCDGVIICCRSIGVGAGELIVAGYAGHVDFLITAHDADDAIERRREHRPAHLENVRRVARDGHVRSAGAILDAEGQMVGSTLHVTFPSRRDLQAWLDSDPYTVGQVWQTVSVQEIRLANLSDPAPQ